MQKFENVDILACLDAVMKQNTGFYQSDFEIDNKIIHEAAASPDREDRTLLWLSRPSGTHCFRERDVFLKDTPPIQHMEVPRGADTRPHPCLRRGADGQGARQNPGKPL